jgi:hypothetical protein
MDELNSDSLKPDENTSIPRIALGEQGYPGLRIFSDKIYEEANTKLRFPHIIQEVDEMRKDSAISTMLNLE